MTELLASRWDVNQKVAGWLLILVVVLLAMAIKWGWEAGIERFRAWRRARYARLDDRHRVSHEKFLKERGIR